MDMNIEERIITLRELLCSGGTIEISPERSLVLPEAEADVIDKSGCIALMSDVSNPEEIQLLLQAGADVNARSNSGRTALMEAARRRIKESIHLLLESGANVNEKDDNGKTALMEVLDIEVFNTSEVIDETRLLIEAGADVNAKDKNGWTALMYAADLKAYRQSKIDTRVIQKSNTIRILLEAGADVNAISNNGYTALMCAAKTALSYGYEPVEYEESYTTANDENLETLRLLLEAGAEVNADNKELNIKVGEAETIEKGETALIYVTAAGNYEALHLLLNAGAEVNARGKNGRTALMEAARVKRIKSIHLLLESGANVNDKDDNGKTALMEVLDIEEYYMNEVIEEMRLLLEAGADVKAQDKNGITALMYASGLSSEYVRLLLEAGADVNTQNKDGVTALMIAIFKPEIIRFLLKSGAQVNSQAKNGQTALGFAQEELKNISQNDKHFEWNLETTIRLLLEAGAEADVLSENKETLNADSAINYKIYRNNIFRVVGPSIEIDSNGGFKMIRPAILA